MHADSGAKATIETAERKELRLKPKRPSNWLVTEKYIYISTDIWLGRFTLNLEIINWKRGIYRFCYLEECEKDCIQVGKEYLYYDLSVRVD